MSNITGIAKPAGNETYGYDNLDRLDDFTLPGSAPVNYSYDAVGNRLSWGQSGVTTNLSYGATSNRLLSNAGVAITYDANGNQIGDGTYTYSYNARDRLAQVSDGATTVADYRYNALGQRVNKTTASADVDFVYDLNGQLLGEYADGAVIREYVHGPSGPLAQIESSGAVRYLHTDHLGTPRAATDANQTVVWRWEGKPFGESAANADPDGDMIDVTVNLRFPGQYFDVETGRHYNYFRTYDPTIGRYITSDPIGLAGGLNTFLYVGSNPLVSSDFYGLETRSGTRQRWNATHGPRRAGSTAIRGFEVRANAAWRGSPDNPSYESNYGTGEVQREVSVFDEIGGGFSFCTLIADEEASDCSRQRQDTGMFGSRYDTLSVGIGRFTGLSFETNGTICVNIGAGIGPPINISRQAR